MLKNDGIEGIKYEKVDIHHLNPKSITMGRDPASTIVTAAAACWGAATPSPRPSASLARVIVSNPAPTLSMDTSRVDGAFPRRPLHGMFDPATLEWQDGILANIVRL